MVGQNIGKYRVLDRVGRGGMGTVYRAIDETLHREVAIKVLNTELNDPGVARRFRSEAVTLARLNHPGIAMIYELFQHEGQWMMVMEFVRGETLESLIARKGALPVEQSADICMQALGALAHAHGNGVVHRDLKPANLILGESGTLKITDFGIARVVGTEHLTSAGFMIGTPAYMAPEQVLGQEIDARADIYAMGVVLYHLATGKLPFKGDTPMQIAQSRLHDQPTPVRSVRQELPAWLGQVLDIALSRAPERRFQSAQLFREALRRGLANLPLDTPQAAVIPPELVATAAPGSLPLAATSAPPPAASPSRVEAMPTLVSSGAVGTTETAARSSGGASVNRMLIAAAGVVLAIVTGVGGWMLVRAPEPAPAADVSSSSTSAAFADAAGVSPAPSVPPAPVASADVSPAGPGAATTPVSPPASTGGTAPAAVSSSAAPPAVASSTTSGSASPAAGARGEGTGTASPARGRGRGPADPAVAFDQIRALVIKGRNSEEQEAVLHFFGGQLSLVLQKGGATLAAMPYGELARATYVRGRSPRWDATLAAPPANLDIPGGIFRTGRHWLALQSKSTYLILRLSDADWRQVIEMVTARTGVKVEPPASGG